jgi:hypothetical protein
MAATNKNAVAAPRRFPVFSFQAPEAYYRIARRGGRWYVEYDGAVAGGFDHAQGAACALARGKLRFEGLDDPGRGVPADIGDWFRGDLMRPRPAARGCRAPPAGAT